jgi:hypothetical protein
MFIIMQTLTLKMRKMVDYDKGYLILGDSEEL